MLCIYGCGRLAIHKFTNGKVCCSKSPNSCPAKAKKTGIAVKKAMDVIDPVSGLIYGGSPNSPLFSVDPITHTITTLLLNIDSNYGYGYAWYNGSLYTANNWFGKIIF